MHVKQLFKQIQNIQNIGKNPYFRVLRAAYNQSNKGEKVRIYVISQGTKFLKENFEKWKSEN